MKLLVEFNFFPETGTSDFERNFMKMFYRYYYALPTRLWDEINLENVEIVKAFALSNDTTFKSIDYDESVPNEFYDKLHKWLDEYSHMYVGYKEGDPVEFRNTFNPAVYDEDSNEEDSNENSNEDSNEDSDEDSDEESDDEDEDVVYQPPSTSPNKFAFPVAAEPYGDERFPQATLKRAREDDEENDTPRQGMRIGGRYTTQNYTGGGLFGLGKRLGIW